MIASGEGESAPLRAPLVRHHSGQKSAFKSAAASSSLQLSEGQNIAGYFSCAFIIKISSTVLDLFHMSSSGRDHKKTLEMNGERVNRLPVTFKMGQSLPGGPVGSSVKLPIGARGDTCHVTLRRGEPVFN